METNCTHVQIEFVFTTHRVRTGSVNTCANWIYISLFKERGQKQEFVVCSLHQFKVGSSFVIIVFRSFIKSKMKLVDIVLVWTSLYQNPNVFQIGSVNAKCFFGRRKKMSLFCMDIISCFYIHISFICFLSTRCIGWIVNSNKAT